MKSLIQNKSFEVKMGVRQKGDEGGKWESKIIRVQTKLDDLAIFAASLKLEEKYPADEGWEFDFNHAEVVVV